MERQIAVLKRETSAKGADWSKIEEMLEGEWDEDKFESALQGIYEADAEVCFGNGGSSANKVG